jgi:hypothetical protein
MFETGPLTAKACLLATSVVARLVAFIVCAFLLLSLDAQPVLAGDKTIDRVNVSSNASGPVIVVHFNVPITYLSHAPSSEGSTIQIEVRPFPEPGREAPVIGLKERASAATNEDVPLTDATYELVTRTAARLTLTFSRSVKFRVTQGGDSRSLEIALTSTRVGSKPVPDIVVEAPPPNPTLDEPVPESTLPEGEIGTTMAQARDAMAKGDHEKAIRLLTRVLGATGNEEVKPEALEMLGLARERNKQIAHAKAEYEEFLRLYPKGDGADRVRQRLAGLITAASKPRAKLREPSRTLASGDGGSEFFYRGSFSQAIRRDENLFMDPPVDGLTRFDLDSDLDTTLTYSDSSIVINLRGNGGYVYDLMDDGQNSKGRVSSLYLEIADPSRAVYGRIGRQSRSTDGVLGRFDGGLLSAQIFEDVRLNLIAGMPVDSSSDLFTNMDRYFGGGGIEFGPIFDDWHVNLYAVDQTTDGIRDRRAVGGEVRYTRPDVAMFGLIDVDTTYDKVNIALFSGNYFFDDQSTFNFSVDYRTSPVLTTTSALQGQPVGTIQDLLMLYPEDTVRQLALDRTGTIKSASIGASHPLNENLQLSFDAMVTDTSGTSTSVVTDSSSVVNTIDGTPDVGLEYFYGAQVTGTSLFTEGDIAALGLRYADQDQYNRATIDLNTRFPVTESLRFNPRLRTDYRWNDRDAGNELSFTPSLRTNYRPLEDWELELELGGDWRNTEDALGVKDDTLGYFAYFTYRLDY